MTCERVRSSLSSYLDRGLDSNDRRLVSFHLGACSACRRDWEDLRALRDGLRALPHAASPSSLRSRLRVAASYEIARRQGRGDFHAGWRTWRTRLRLAAHDLWRPLAVPAAGGLLSSVVFFAMLVNTFGFAQPAANDTPLGIFTQVTVDELSPFGYSGDATVELTIDKDGHVSDYSVPSGTVSRDQLKQLGKLILFTSFAPATSFGQPVSGKVLVKSHRINVRG